MALSSNKKEEIKTAVETGGPKINEEAIEKVGGPPIKLHTEKRQETRISMRDRDLHKCKLG